MVKKGLLYSLLFVILIGAISIGAISSNAITNYGEEIDGTLVSGEISSTIDYKDVANSIRSTVMNVPPVARVLSRGYSPVQIQRSPSYDIHNSLSNVNRGVIRLISGHYIGRQVQSYEHPADYYIFTLRHITI